VDALAEVLRRSASLRVEEATPSLTRLTEVAASGRRLVVVARLEDTREESSDVLAHADDLPIVLLVPDARRDAIQALAAGAGAVLGLEASEEQIAAAVVSVFHGLVAIPGGLAHFAERQAAWEAPPEPLTPREIEILGLLAAGDSNRTIAARLSISVHTVKFHISSILSKLGVASRTEAVALGLKLGIVLL